MHIRWGEGRRPPAINPNPWSGLRQRVWPACVRGPGVSIAEPNLGVMPNGRVLGFRWDGLCRGECRKICGVKKFGISYFSSALEHQCRSVLCRLN